MPYNDYSSRVDLAGGIPEPIVGQIIDGLEHESLVARAFTTFNMPSGTARFPVMDALPIAYWQTPAETGVGQPSEVKWANKTVTAETLQVFVPVPRAVLEDSAFDVWANITPKIVEALAYKLDQAVLFGTGAPSSFPTSVYAQIQAASNDLTANTAAASGGLAEDFNRAAEKIVVAGYDPDAILAGRRLANLIRRSRASDGQRFGDFLAVDSYDGMPIYYGANSGLFGSGSGQPIMIMLDSSQYVLGIRRDMDIKLMEEAVITDPAGNVLYNAATQDGVILGIRMRAGWQVANAVTIDSQFGGTNEVQTLTQSGVTSGTQTISFGGYSTSALDREATAAEVQAALEALPSIGAGNVSVARSGSAGARVYTVTFQNALGSTNVGNLSATSTAGSIAQATTTSGASGVRASAAALKAA
jgi:HK97 family phage major capsid protein